MMMKNHWLPYIAGLVELVDIAVLEAVAEMRVGSSPMSGTK